MSRAWPQSVLVQAVVEYMAENDLAFLEFVVMDTEIPHAKNVVIRASGKDTPIGRAQGVYTPDAHNDPKTVLAAEEVML